MKIAKNKVGKKIDREVKKHFSQANSHNLVTT
jgi:predicted Fe-Mo cluster-binding NifX family protein